MNVFLKYWPSDPDYDPKLGLNWYRHWRVQYTHPVEERWTGITFTIVFLKHKLNIDIITSGAKNYVKTFGRYQHELGFKLFPWGTK